MAACGLSCNVPVPRLLLSAAVSPRPPGCHLSTANHHLPVSHDSLTSSCPSTSTTDTPAPGRGLVTAGPAITSSRRTRPMAKATATATKRHHRRRRTQSRSRCSSTSRRSTAASTKMILRTGRCLASLRHRHRLGTTKKTAGRGGIPTGPASGVARGRRRWSAGRRFRAGIGLRPACSALIGAEGRDPDRGTGVMSRPGLPLAACRLLPSEDHGHRHRHRQRGSLLLLPRLFSSLIVARTRIVRPCRLLYSYQTSTTS